MRTTLLKVIAFLALASMFAMAQHGNPPDPAKMAQHHLDFLTKQLSLTTQQQQQAATIFNEVGNTSKATHEQMKTAHDSLKAAIQKNDTAGIEQAANTIGSLTTQMTVAHAKAQAAFYQTLTPEQQTKMNELESHHGMGMGRGMHGHGGPDGPPPGASL
jgi:Spy/CpxP family protein refolding chaperone